MHPQGLTRKDEDTLITDDDFFELALEWEPLGQISFAAKDEQPVRFQMPSATNYPDYSYEQCSRKKEEKGT